MHPLAALSGEEKKKLGEYVFEHFKRDFEESEYGERHLSKEFESESESFGAWLKYFDGFLLYGKTRKGSPVIDAAHDARNLFTDEEKSVVKEWRDKAFASVFEIRGIHPRHLDLYDLIAEVSLVAHSNMDKPMTEFFGNTAHIGHFLHTNLAPIQGEWFLSGARRQFLATIADRCMNPTSKKSPFTRYTGIIRRNWRARLLRKKSTTMILCGCSARTRCLRAALKYHDFSRDCTVRKCEKKE